MNTRSYKVKTVNGGIYIRNRKLIKARNTDFKHSLQNTRGNMTHEQSTTYTERPRQITRRPQRFIESMNYVRTWHPQQRFS